MVKEIRKRIIAMFVTLALMISLMPAMTLSARAADAWNGTTTPFSIGDGSSGDPYQIGTGEQLAYMAYMVNNDNGNYGNKHYILVADIVLNNTTNFENWETNPPANQWMPIGSNDNVFIGTFDGNGHTINGLYINDSSAQNQALFGRIDSPAMIKDVILTDFYVYGSAYSAGICGYIYGGSVTGCSVSGVIKGASNNYGGIAGFNSGAISCCVNNAAVTAVKVAGGIAGINANNISDSYNTGRIEATSATYDSDTGGIVGQNQPDTQVSNCYNLGTVVGYYFAGGGLSVTMKD